MIKNIWFFIVHQAGDFLTLTWIGSRLKCPMCGTYGYWRPFGGFISRAFGDNRGKRRWLCKWCGWFVEEEGWAWASLYKGAPAWALKRDMTEEQLKTAYTPKSVYEKAMRGIRDD